MPQIGWFEILIIVVLSILIIGPKDFPIMIRKIGGWIGSFKNYFNEMQKDFNDVSVDLDENDSLNKENTNLNKNIKEDE